MKPSAFIVVDPSAWHFRVECYECMTGSTGNQLTLSVKAVEYVCGCGKTWTIKQSGKITRKYKARTPND